LLRSALNGKPHPKKRCFRKRRDQRRHAFSLRARANAKGQQQQSRNDSLHDRPIDSIRFNGTVLGLRGCSGLILAGRRGHQSAAELPFEPIFEDASSSTGQSVSAVAS
jgi:hypothetical protein